MGLMPEGAGNPYTRLDKQGVIGTLKATGSKDPDILYAQKARLLAPAKHLKMLAIIMVAVGEFFTVTVVLAIAGIPLILFAWWTWRFSRKNIATVESAFAEYAASS